MTIVSFYDILYWYKLLTKKENIMAKKRYLIFGIIGIIILLYFSCSANNLINTEWRNERGTILTFGETSYRWVQEDGRIGTGIYSISGDTVNINFSDGTIGIGSLSGRNLIITGNNIEQSIFLRIK